MKYLKRIACITIAVIFAISSVCAMQTSQVSAASKPAKVKSLTLKLDKQKKQIQISWKKAKRAKKYEVYMKAPGQNWKKLKITKAKRIIYAAPKAGQYSFKVRGVKKSKKGKFSKTKTITLSKSLWKTKKPSQAASSAKSAAVTKPTKAASTANPTKTSPSSQPSNVTPSTTKPTSSTGTTSGTVKVQKIYIEGNSAIYPGESTTLTASVYPYYASNQSVRWQVEKYAGVTVKVKGNSITFTSSKSTPIGTFRIAATAQDGSGVRTNCGITIKEKPIRGISLINLYPIYDDSIPSYPGIQQSKINNLFRLDDYADKQFLMIYLDTDLGGLSPDWTSWHNITTGRVLQDHYEVDSSRDGRDHYSLLDVRYKNTNHSDRQLARGGLLIPLKLSKGDVVKGKNTIQLWSSRYSREKGYECMEVMAELQIDVQSRADAYTAYIDQVILDSKNYVSKTDAFYQSKSKGVTKNSDLFYQLYCVQDYLRDKNQYWPSMMQGDSAAPLYTLASTGKVIDTGYGGCEDGAVLMTLACMLSGVSAEGTTQSGSLHKICVVDNSEALFGKAGVTFDGQPHLTKYSTMKTEEQYQAFVNSVQKIY